MKYRFFFFLLAAACAAPEAKPATESDVPVDGAFDSFRNPTDLGELTLGETTQGELTRRDQFLAWTFSLTDDATVSLFTRDAGDGEVDTVAYLYQEGERGWGRYLERNDDFGDSYFSRITAELGVGRYRILVKGYSSRTEGRFTLDSTCFGPGCPSDEPPAACGLGATYHDLIHSSAFAQVSQVVVRDVATLDARQSVQLFNAVQFNYTEVTNVSEALQAVDGAEVNLTELRHRDGRVVRAYEYGAGDNSYGAIFVADTTELAARIVDGDLADCTFEGETPSEGGVAGDDCNDTLVCVDGLRCEGFVAEAGFGKCVSTERLPNEGAECASDAACGEGAICAGVSRGYGLCAPAWMRGSFSDTESVAIPDADPAGLVRTLAAYGLATVDTDADLTATIRHEFPGDLLVTLTNPSGNEMVVFDGQVNAWDDETITLSGPIVGLSGDESVNGVWTLRVVDREARDVGTLEGWALTITSRWD
jgi:subtilisin-like proprotein convertase family protein